MAIPGRAAVVVTVLIVAAACGGDDGSSAETTTTTSPAVDATTAPTVEETTKPVEETTAPTVEETTEPTVEETAEPSVEETTDPTVEETTEPSTAPAAAQWERIVPGGDCQCSDGSEFSFWVRRADPSKVLFFLQGGGACFSAESCDPVNGTYKVSTGPGDSPAEADGVFDLDDDRNPLADFSMVFVPYCTGDVHLGNKVNAYSPELTINHVGAVNAGTALAELVRSFPDATEVLVAGESAGSIPTPLYGGLLADLLPDADIEVLGDGSGAYPDVAGINGLLDSLWGVVDALPDWPETAGLTAETWSFPELFVVAGQHAPEVTFARHDYAFDEAQAFFASLGGVDPSNLVSLIDANEVLIEAGGVDLLSYIAPGMDHTVLSRPEFYTETVEGTSLATWVTDVIADRPVADVHCVNCQG